MKIVLITGEVYYLHLQHAHMCRAHANPQSLHTHAYTHTHTHMRTHMYTQMRTGWPISSATEKDKSTEDFLSGLLGRSVNIN